MEFLSAVTLGAFRLIVGVACLPAILIAWTAWVGGDDRLMMWIARRVGILDDDVGG